MWILSFIRPLHKVWCCLKMVKNNAEAKAFYDFVLSAKAKEVFKKYGYLVHE